LTIKALTVRPVVLCAVLRGFTFTEENYASFIDCQDKLHQNVCRKRSLASIGTHDLDTIVGPFYYSAQNPKDINFIPLNKENSCNGHELMEILSKVVHIYFFVFSPVFYSSIFIIYLHHL
jgi:phenylalanyl-tRNA synthetase beta chain